MSGAALPRDRSAVAKRAPPTSCCTPTETGESRWMQAFHSFVKCAFCFHARCTVTHCASRFSHLVPTVEQLVKGSAATMFGA